MFVLVYLQKSYLREKKSWQTERGTDRHSGLYNHVYVTKKTGIMGSQTRLDSCCVLLVRTISDSEMIPVSSSTFSHLFLKTFRFVKILSSFQTGLKASSCKGYRKFETKRQIVTETESHTDRRKRRRTNELKDRFGERRTVGQSPTSSQTDQNKKAWEWDLPSTKQT